MTTSINIFIEYDGFRNPFEIQPRCRVGRMREVIEKAIGIKIEKIIHQRHTKHIKDILEVDDQKYLQEDMKIENGDIIIIEGHIVATPNYGNMINVMLVYKTIQLKTKISQECKVKGLLDLAKQSGLFIPDSIKIKYKNQVLSNHNDLLIEKFGVVENDEFEMVGTFFPVKLFGMDYLVNHGVYTSAECIICLENKSTKLFDCGHLNVCQNCLDMYDNNMCPICKNK